MRMGRSQIKNETCEECGKSFGTYARGKALYCSPACKQRAYRKRKKQRDNAKALTRSMDTYSRVNEVMSDIHPTCKSSFNLRLWQVLDTLPSEAMKEDVLNIVYRAIQNSTHRIEKLGIGENE